LSSRGEVARDQGTQGEATAKSGAAMGSQPGALEVLAFCGVAAWDSLEYILTYLGLGLTIDV